MTSARNLLIIISDEHRRDAMGCAGHRVVQTPHLDALAAHGMRFTNAYTPSPMCVPARAAMATGDYVHKARNWDSATPYDGDMPGWMHACRPTLPVTSIGKLHFRSTDDDNGFARELLPMHVVGGTGWPIGLLRQDPPPFEAAAELAADVGTGPSSYTDYDRAITARAVDWLAQRDATPWAGFLSLVSPHYPLTAPKDFARLYDPAQLDEPVAPDQVHSHPEVQNIAGFFDYARHFDPQSSRAARAAYYGLTSFLDDCVGQILAALDATGQRDETLIIYTSDHGEMLGDHGLWTKQVMYEASVGVPLIVSGPGIPEAATCTTTASLLDIAATARDVAGLPPDDKPGRSLIQMANAPSDPDRTILSEYHDGGSKTASFMIRWGDWKYVHYVGHAPQLFDLTQDPSELTDIATQRPEITAEGEARLRAICDPEAVNARAFADQRAKIEALGGREAILNAPAFNHTPTPTG